MYAWIADDRAAGVSIKKPELFVKKIGRSQREKTVPVRQPVADSRIDCYEVIAAGPPTCVIQYKMAVLIDVRCPEGGAPSGRVEKADP